MAIEQVGVPAYPMACCLTPSHLLLVLLARPVLERVFQQPN